MGSPLHWRLPWQRRAWPARHKGRACPRLEPAFAPARHRPARRRCASRVRALHHRQRFRLGELLVAPGNGRFAGRCRTAVFRFVEAPVVQLAAPAEVHGPVPGTAFLGLQVEDGVHETAVNGDKSSTTGAAWPILWLLLGAALTDRGREVLRRIEPAATYIKSNRKPEWAIRQLCCSRRICPTRGVECWPSPSTACSRTVR